MVAVEERTHLEAGERDGEGSEGMVVGPPLSGIEWRRISGRTSAALSDRWGPEGGEDCGGGGGGDLRERRPAARLDSWRK